MTGSPSRLNQLCHFGNSLSFTETDSRSIFDQYEPISELVKYSKLPVEDFSFPVLDSIADINQFVVCPIRKVKSKTGHICACDFLDLFVLSMISFSNI